jgi:transcriptional regulator with XRE-family HTH domain
MTPQESADTTSAKHAFLESLADRDYRREFVAERVRSSIALQIRALRDQRHMSQSALGDEIGMAQTWVSKLENPDYGKMTVATLLRLADAFDTDLEIKFRPFTESVDTLTRQSEDYFTVPSFTEEFPAEK